MTSWAVYERRMLPFVHLRHALKALGDRDSPRAPLARGLRVQTFSSSLLTGQPVTTISMMNALSQCLAAFQTGHASRRMLHWARKALDFLDFAIVIIFLLTGNVAQPWTSAPRWDDLGGVGNVLKESFFVAGGSRGARERRASSGDSSTTRSTVDDVPDRDSDSAENEEGIGSGPQSRGFGAHASARPPPRPTRPVPPLP